MKKRVLLLLPLFLGACSDSGESPVITIERLYVNTDPDSEDSKGEDYTNQKDNLPALKVGDKVNAFLLLDGNGAELKTFKLQNDEAVKAELRYEKAEVSTEGNLTDEEKGQLRFKDGVDVRLKELIKETCDLLNVEIIEMEIMPDHVHLLMEVDPQFGVHKAVKQIKGYSSKVLRTEFPWLKSRLPSLWTNSYFVSTVGGAPLAVIKQYIENQKNV